VGATTYIARVRRSELSEISGLRWAGRLLPKDKVSAQLWRAVSEQPAPPNTKRGVVVYFEGGTSEDAAMAVIRRHSRMSQRYGTVGTWAIEIRQGALERLAGEPSVFWVESLPEGRLPLGGP
jgi:hypothetical protein